MICKCRINTYKHKIILPKLINVKSYFILCISFTVSISNRYHCTYYYSVGYILINANIEVYITHYMSSKFMQQSTINQKNIHLRKFKMMKPIISKIILKNNLLVGLFFSLISQYLLIR